MAEYIEKWDPESAIQNRQIFYLTISLDQNHFKTVSIAFGIEYDKYVGQVRNPNYNPNRLNIQLGPRHRPPSYGTKRNVKTFPTQQEIITRICQTFNKNERDFKGLFVIGVQNRLSEISVDEIANLPTESYILCQFEQTEEERKRKEQEEEKKLGITIQFISHVNRGRKKETGGKSRERKKTSRRKKSK